MSNIDQFIRLEKLQLLKRIFCLRFIGFCICVVGCIQLSAQPYYQLDIASADSIILKENNLNPADSLLLDSVLVWIIAVQDEGYLEVSIDELQEKDSLILGDVHLGPKYSWLQLNNHNIDKNILESSKIDLDLLSSRIVNLTQLKNIKENILTVYENNGYPYAKIWIDNIIATDSSLAADLMVEKGILARYEEIVVDGDVNISEAFLSSYLGIKENDIYNRSELKKIDNKLNELSFLSLKNNARAFFNKDKVRIELPVTRRRSSRFDFLLGFQPNSRRDAGGVSLTGTFLGDFINQLGQGERIFLAYKKLGVGTQELEMALNYPYILGSPFGFDASFDLYKRDSSYVNIDAEVGVQVLISGNNYVKAFWNNRSTNLAEVDSMRVADSSQDDIDTRFSNFGLEFSWRQLNHPQSPTRGFLIKTRGSVGQRTIKLNQDILETNPAFYNNVNPSSFQFLASTDLQYYIPLGKRSTLMLRSQGGWLHGADTLFKNQLFRIGGNRILRGFDDESIFASIYGVGTAEYRFILGTNRYLFLFGDGGFIKEQSKGVNRTDIPFGFGGGLRFQTSTGVFSLTYAMGKQEGAGLDFSRSKVHFGFVTFF